MSLPTAAAASVAAAHCRSLSPSTRADDDNDRPAQAARVDGGDAETAVPPAAFTRPLTLPSHSLAQRSAVDQTDAWLCMLACLQLEDLPAVVQTCRSWQHGAMKERSRQSGYHTGRLVAELNSALRSPLLRLHVRSLRIQLPESTEGGSALDHTDAWLTRVRDSMPSLTQLHVSFSTDLLTALSADPAVAQVDAPRRQQFIQRAFSPTLTSLSLSLGISTSFSFGSSFTLSAPVMQLLVDSLPSAANLRELIISNERQQLPDGVRWEPLMQLHSLERVQLIDCGLIRPQLCAVLKQLPALMDLHACIQIRLRELCELPHRLSRLTALSLADTEVGKAEAEWLCHLPALTSLHPAVLHPAAFPLLPRFTRVHSLSVFTCKLHADGVAVLTSALRAMSSLTELRLQLWTACMMREVLSAVPGLQSLHVCNAFGGLVSTISLDLLPPLPALTRFIIGRNVTLEDPMQLLQLGTVMPRLRELSLERTAILLALDVFDPLSPPSSALPSLRRLQVGDRCVQMADATSQQHTSRPQV